MKIISGFKVTVISVLYSCSLIAMEDTDYEAQQNKSSSLKEHEVIGSHGQGVSSLVLDRNILYSASRDKIIKLWDINTNKQLHEIPNDEEISSVVVSKDKLFCAGIRYVQDKNTCQRVQTITVDHSQYIPPGEYV